MIRAVLALMLLAAPAAAETVVAARTIPARSIIGTTDVYLQAGIIPGTANTAEQVVGYEARVALYAGRPIRPGDVGPPAVVERNDVIPLIFDHGGIFIAAEGRALERAGPGEVIRVMNISSRNTVRARIADDGSAIVAAQDR